MVWGFCVIFPRCVYLTYFPIKILPLYIPVPIICHSFSVHRPSEKSIRVNSEIIRAILLVYILQYTVRMVSVGRSGRIGTAGYDGPRSCPKSLNPTSSFCPDS